MKVLILAGGYGTRLAEETDIRPKPMVEVGGMPIIWHIMKYYSSYGFNEFVILLGYKGYYIKEYFANYFLHQSDVMIDMVTGAMTVLNNACEPWKVTLLDTGRDTMTGGRVARAKNIVGKERFMLTYGDGVGDVNLDDLLLFHESHGQGVTMTSCQPSGRFGLLDVESDGRVAHFREKPSGVGGWVNAGFFVCEHTIFEYLMDGDETILERQPLESLVHDGKLYTYRHEGFWKPMDTLRDKIELQEIWEKGVYW